MRNISFNFLAQFWFLGLSFFTTPYIVNTLGTDAFGVYSIIGVVMGYFAFLDLGLGNAIIKYLAEFWGKREYRKISDVIGTSLVVYGLIGLMGGFVLIILTPTLVNDFLHIPKELETVTRFAFYVSALGFLINMPLAIFGNIPNALQRMDITNIRNIIIGSLNTLGIVFLLYKGYGLTEIVVLNVILSIVGIIVYVVISKKLLAKVSFGFKFNLGMFKKLFSFGIFKFLNQMAGQIIFQLDKFLIGLFLPISWVAYYTVPLTLSSKVMSLVFNIAGAFFPSASELSGREDKKPFWDLYTRSMKLVSILVVPFFVMLFVYGRLILKFWVKGDFPDKATITLQLLALAYLIQSFTTIPSLAAESLGRPKVTAFWSLIAAVVNLGLCLLLIPKMGINGAALAIFLNSLLVCPVSVFYINKKVIGFSSKRLFFESMFKALVAVVITLPLFVLLRLYFIKNLILLILAVLIGEIVYLGVSLVIGVIDERDKQIALEFLNRFRKK